MKSFISLPQIPKNINPELSEFLTSLLRVITEKQTDDYSAIDELKKEIESLKK